MQTLISTARACTPGVAINADRLKIGANSIGAGTRYIASQFAVSGFDPPKVACAYNAGGLYYDSSPTNQWRMRQFPIGTPLHANRMVAFFNDCFSVLYSKTRPTAGKSLAKTLAGG
jgi:hypothetical protein